MNWLEQFFRASKNLYKGFILRDILGYVLPGTLVLIFLLLNVSECEFNGIIDRPIIKYLLNLPYTVTTIAFFLFSYLIGLSIFGIGLLIGLLHYYPHYMTRLSFHCELVQFTSNPDIAKFREERDRLVIMLHACGNISIAALICFIQSLFLKIYWVSAVLLILWISSWIRHWEIVFNLRSYQEAILSTHNIKLENMYAKQGCLDKFFELGGLFGLFKKKK